MFNFTPLLGAQSSSPASQSLLELDGGIKILVDVGWDEAFDVDKLKELERHVSSLSLILLTHATTSHLGAFAHCCKHVPSFTRIPIYATSPVKALGQTLLQDIYASTPLAAAIIPASRLTDSAYAYQRRGSDTTPKILLSPPTDEEIRKYFSLIHPLKYSQPHQPIPSPFSPPLNGLTITAYNAGHTLGGTIWHIQHGLESVVYAVDWNQAKEHVLSGAAWLGGGAGAEVIEPLRRPTALVCGTRGAQRIASAGGTRRRDELLLTHIKDTLSKGGTVLIPSDSSARVLELAYLLENAWSSAPTTEQDDASLRKASLHFMSRSSVATMSSARGLLEWMEESMMEFESAGDRNQQSTDSADSFNFRFMTLLSSQKSLRRVLSRSGSKVIIASDTSLEWGHAREALRSIAQDSSSLVILTDCFSRNFEHDSLGKALWKVWQENQGDDSNEPAQIQAGGAQISLKIATVSSLDPGDLPVYQRYLARQRQVNETAQIGQVPSTDATADAIDDASSTTSSSSSEDLETEHQGKALNAAAMISHSRRNLLLTDAELGVNVLIRRKGIYDFEVRGKRGRDRIFPHINKRKKNDDFGDLIRPDDYLRAEERDEVDGEDMRDGVGKKGTAVGEKRKWGDLATRTAADSGRRMSNGINKRHRGVGDGLSAGDYDVSDEEDDEEQLVQGPRKVSFQLETLQLKLGIAYVEFSGLADRRSFQMLIPLIRPRKLILTGGDEEETHTIAEDCRQLLGTGESADRHVEVFTPLVGHMVDASVDTNAWAVKLSQSLFQRLHWQNVRGLGVVALTGRLEAALPEDEPDEGSIKKKLKTIQGESENASKAEDTAKGITQTPFLDVVPASMAGATRTVAQPIHVGDLRLADLRKLMQSSGYTAEFRGEGILLVNGMVAVRKSGTGKIEVEASMSLPMGRGDPTFYDVKKRIYEGLAVVAGG